MSTDFPIALYISGSAPRLGVVEHTVWELYPEWLSVPAVGAHVRAVIEREDGDRIYAQATVDEVVWLVNDASERAYVWVGTIEAALMSDGERDDHADDYGAKPWSRK